MIIKKGKFMKRLKAKDMGTSVRRLNWNAITSTSANHNKHVYFNQLTIAQSKREQLVQRAENACEKVVTYWSSLQSKSKEKDLLNLTLGVPCMLHEFYRSTIGKLEAPSVRPLTCRCLAVLRKFEATATKIRGKWSRRRTYFGFH